LRTKGIISYIFSLGLVVGKKASFYPVDAATFASKAGEEITQMLQYFSDFGCKSRCATRHDHKYLAKSKQLCLPFTQLDFGGKDVGPSKKVLPADVKVQTWAEFVKVSDWSKVLS
jgi:hypothetical protein